MRWLVNDAEAARVGKIGFPAPDATTIIDHGGTPEVIVPRQLNCGMAMFTLLDGGLAGCSAATRARRSAVEASSCRVTTLRPARK